LAGYSFGGMVAFEMSKKLQSHGKIAWLGIINLPPFIKERMHQIDPVTGLLNLIHFLDLFSGPDLLKIRGEIEDMATVRDQLSHVLLRAPERRVAELNLDVDKLDRWLGVAQSMCEVGKAYDPSGRVDNLTVFIADPLKAVAKDRPEWRGKVGEWQRFVREGVNLVDVEGAHYTVLSPEYVRGFTKHFKQAMAAGRATSKPFEHMGVLYPPVCSPLSLRKLADFKPNPDDIVVATYPKSGTTWMLHILYQLKSKGRMDFEKITDCCPWLDTLQAWDGIVDGAVGEQRIIKTHSPPDLIAAGAKCIYLVRHPSQVVRSYYRHACNFHFTGTFDEYFSKFVEGDVIFGSWFEHAKLWTSKAKDPNYNVLLVNYDDLRMDFRRVVLLVAEFWDIGISADDIDELSERFSLEFMRKHSSKFDYSWLPSHKGVHEFFHGKAAAELSTEQKAILEAKIAEFGLADLWKA
jgi:thioesterase domain-containing protein